MYSGLYEFLGPLSLSLSPKTTISKETDDDGQELYKMELELSGGRVETHWIVSDLETVYPVKGRSYQSDRNEAFYEVLETERKDIHGVTLEYPTKLKWETASSRGYQMWLAEIKETSEILNFSPDDYDFSVVDGIAVQDKILNIRYVAGGVAGEVKRVSQKEFLTLSIQEPSPEGMNVNSASDVTKEEQLDEEDDRISQFSYVQIILWGLFLVSLLYFVLRLLLSKKKRSH